jgi:hypothetical protein
MNCSTLRRLTWRSSCNLQAYERSTAVGATRCRGRGFCCKHLGGDAFSRNGKTCGALVSSVGETPTRRNCHARRVHGQEGATGQGKGASVARGQGDGNK